jgi:putative cardiolipin synthase
MLEPSVVAAADAHGSGNPTASTRRRGAAALLALSIASGCSTYNTKVLRSESHALGLRPTTKLGVLFEPAAVAHPGRSGVNYIRDARVALEGRLAMVDLAEQSLDLQYYIWDPDISGGLLGERVVRAAERGVRVRLLLDDHSVVGRDREIARLTGHPNIEVRAFNPFRDRKRWRDFFSEPSRINRRSHNKIFVADNTVAIIGGRNIADHYFGVHGVSNYRDLDAIAVGPVVRDVSAVFDSFWNSKFAVPYGAFVHETPTPEDAAKRIAELRAQVARAPLPYAIDEDVVALVGGMQHIRDDLIWGSVRVLHDQPAKAEDSDARGIVGELAALASNAKREVLIENAYFVPRDPMLKIIAGLTARGVRVRVLTNSMASNDVAAVVSGYKKYRKKLLEVGAEIYELRPDSAMKRQWSLLSTKSRSGLHTKTMVVDREHVVIGSYNLDPRSADINSECALLVDSPAFGERVGAFLDEGVSPEQSFHVTLANGRPRWTTVTDGHEIVYTHEPETGWWQRFTVGVLGLLPIHSQL